MKKVVVIAIAALLAAPACFAQTAVPTVPVAKHKAPTAATLSGKIDSVILGDPAADTKTILVVSDNAGKSIQLVLAKTATITDKDGKSLTADKLAKGQKVKVKYTEVTGGAIATAVAVAE